MEIRLCLSPSPRLSSRTVQIQSLCVSESMHMLCVLFYSQHCETNLEQHSSNKRVLFSLFLNLHSLPSVCFCWVWGWWAVIFTGSAKCWTHISRINHLPAMDNTKMCSCIKEMVNGFLSKHGMRGLVSISCMSIKYRASVWTWLA